VATEDLAGALGYEFSRPQLLKEALTHPSALTPEGGRGRTRSLHRSYERLEFLGDRVLGLVIAHLLWHRFEHEPEGHLTRRHTHLVRRETLARAAGAMRLAKHLLLSRAEVAAGAATNPGILADACEAVIAAVYLDGGFEAATKFVRRFWEPLIAEMDDHPPRDPKTALQEWAQARGLALPVYELVETNGPPHAPLFTIAASVSEYDPATATASSKRLAEAKAAALLLDRLTPEASNAG
jgi:ribonuclease-3